MQQESIYKIIKSVKVKNTINLNVYAFVVRAEKKVLIHNKYSYDKLKIIIFYLF